VNKEIKKYGYEMFAAFDKRKKEKGICLFYEWRNDSFK
jgi:hypothetical protein